jgi:hypothetical protein
VAETALYNGGSGWATYWTLIVDELHDQLVSSGLLDDHSIDAFLFCCADPAWWTQTIAFTAVAGRVAGLANRRSLAPPSDHQATGGPRQRAETVA